MEERRIESEMAELAKLIAYPSEDVGQLAIATRAALKAMINSVFPVIRLLATPYIERIAAAIYLQSGFEELKEWAFTWLLPKIDIKSL